MAEDKLFVEATEEDVPSIIGLRQRIWSTTYRGIYPDSMIDEFDWDRHREMELLRVHHPAYSVYLIRKGRQNIGYLTINKTDVITLQSLYIVSEYQRQGIGRQAFDFMSAIAGSTMPTPSSATVFRKISMLEASMSAWAAR